MDFLMGLAALSVVLGGSALQDAPLGEAEINAALRAYKPSPAPADPFSSTPPSSLSGRSVQIEKLITMKGAAGTHPFYVWQYDLPSQQLEVAVLVENFQTMTAFMEGDRFVVPVSNPVDGFQTFNEAVAGSITTMSNGFGAKVDVQSFRETTYGVAEVAESYRSLVPGGNASFHTWSKRMPPEEAKELTDSLAFVARGEVRDFLPGRSVVCGSNYQEPTRNNPKEVLGETCLLTVKWSQFDLVNRSTGESLHTWR